MKSKKNLSKPRYKRLTKCTLEIQIGTVLYIVDFKHEDVHDVLPHDLILFSGYFVESKVLYSQLCLESLCYDWANMVWLPSPEHFEIKNWI